MRADLLGRHLTEAEIAPAVYTDLVYPDLHEEREREDKAVRAHLGTCHECQRRVAEARQLDVAVGQLLRTPEVTVPPFDVADVIARARRSQARRSQTTRLPALVPRQRSSAYPLVRHLALAASLFVCAIGGIAFAFPASSLGRTLTRLIGSEHLVRVAAPSHPLRPATSSLQGAKEIALHPKGLLTVEFHEGMPSSLLVQYCDTTLATLRIVSSPVPTESASPPMIHFAVSNDRIRVTAARADDKVVLTLPESARAVSVTRDGGRTPVIVRPRSGTRRADGCHVPFSVLLRP